MKKIAFAVLTVIAGFQFGVAQATSIDARQPTAQAALVSQATPAPSHSILDLPPQKRWDSWDFSSGHDADGVPVPRS
jgi:hypothetical protein